MFLLSFLFVIQCVTLSVLSIDTSDRNNYNLRNNPTLHVEQKNEEKNLQHPVVFGGYMLEEDYMAFQQRAMSTANFTCTFAPTDCNNHGVCNQAGDACICDDDYATYDASAESGECNYKRKSGLVALLLSIFVGYTGAVYFYVGEIGMGCIQLLLAGIGGMFIFGCIGACCDGAMDSKDPVCTKFLTSLVALAAVGMWITVLVLVAGGTLDDSNGIGLSPID